MTIQTFKKGASVFVISSWDRTGGTFHANPCTVLSWGAQRATLVDADGGKVTLRTSELADAEQTRVVPSTADALSIALDMATKALAKDRAYYVQKLDLPAFNHEGMVKAIARIDATTPSAFIGSTPAGWEEKMAELRNTWGNYRIETRTEFGSAAHRNRARYSGTKVHKLTCQYVVGIIDEKLEDAKSKTFGATWLRTRQPVLFSCSPCCGTTSGQHAGAPIAGLTAESVTCDKCRA